MVSVFLNPNPSDRTNVYKMSMSMLKICCQLACVDFVPEGGEAATSSVSSWSSHLGGGRVRSSSLSSFFEESLIVAIFVWVKSASFGRRAVVVVSPKRWVKIEAWSSSFF